MESKKDIRKRVLEIRNRITDEEWKEKSCSICEKVATHPFFLNADTIYCYVDYHHEVSTKAIIEEAWVLGKKVAVPKINGNDMEFYYIQTFSELSEGYRGILEPQTKNQAQDEQALVILPGVAFDRVGNRLGYGKGYYDRYLNKHKNHHTLAICFSCQLVDTIPVESHDLRPEVLITEEYIYESNDTK